jgi:hypothetical protein
MSQGDFIALLVLGGTFGLAGLYLREFRAALVVGLIYAGGYTGLLILKAGGPWFEFIVSLRAG